MASPTVGMDPRIKAISNHSTLNTINETNQVVVSSDLLPLEHTGWAKVQS
jgi:hypothetical protein